MTKRALGILLLALLVQSGVWGAVTVSWTDSVGPHNVPLVCDWNPEYDGTPYSLEKKFAWQGAISVYMETMGPIQFTVSGNFYGGEEYGYPDVWYQVRIEQTVVNLTGVAWNGFDMETANLVPDPNAGRDPTFYNMYSYEPADWWVDMYPMYCTFYPDPEDPSPPYVENTGTFYDVLKVNSDVDFGTGDGGFYLYKYAAGVPEPSSLAAVVGCIAGLAVYLRRRRA